MNKIVQDCFPDRNYTRLTGYDYSSPGSYFVTICVYKKHCLFGTIEGGRMHLNQYGEIVQKCWEDLPHHYAGIDNQVFTVMPNHVHGIIVINDADRRSSSKLDPTGKYPLPEIIHALKT
jgi:putative transposase